MSYLLNLSPNLVTLSNVFTTLKSHIVKDNNQLETLDKALFLDLKNLYNTQLQNNKLKSDIVLYLNDNVDFVSLNNTEQYPTNDIKSVKRF